MAGLSWHVLACNVQSVLAGDGARTLPSCAESREGRERPRESHRGRVCGIGARHALREGQARVRAEERLRARLLQP